MMSAAHPQPDDVATGTRGVSVPPSVVVPDRDGRQVAVPLEVDDDGVVCAPHLDGFWLTEETRRYVLKFCDLWTWTLAGKQSWASPPQPSEASQPPRRVQVWFDEQDLRAMVGLADDEVLIAVVVNAEPLALRLVVESPRLPHKPGWNSEAPYVKLPLSAAYEQTDAHERAEPEGTT